MLINEKHYLNKYNIPIIKTIKYSIIYIKHNVVIFKKEKLRVSIYDIIDKGKLCYKIVGNIYELPKYECVWQKVLLTNVKYT